MAVYDLNVTSVANYLESLVAALDDAGILTTTHYNSGNDLIVTTTMSNKVIRFNITTGTYRPSIYYGDAYTSGTTITNQVTLFSLASETYTSAAVVITDKLLYFGTRNTTERIVNVVFGRLENVTQEYIAASWYTNVNSGGPVIRDTTNDAGAELLSMKPLLVSSGGYYYKTDIVVTSAVGVILDDTFPGLSSLLKGYDVSTIYTVFGDDVAINGGTSNAALSYIPACLLIEDGESWEPA